jgi:(E)-4-hydroxy-3-methylbut-2-enyl-diphosphate synthase
LVVGLPFKDIATADSIYLTQVPASSDAASRRAIKRLQEVAVGVLAPIEQLINNPLPNAIAVISLDDLATMGLPALPEGAVRYAVKMTGIEPVGHYDTLRFLTNMSPKVRNFDSLFVELYDALGGVYNYPSLIYI